MAKRYSVASPSTGTGAANVLYAGGGRVGGGGIPKGSPSGFSIDLGLDKMRQKTEDDEKRKYLISGGLDPKAVALMDTQSLDMGVRAMSDDLISAKEKKSELADAELLGKFFQDLGKARQESFGGSDLSGESGIGPGHGEVTGESAVDWADREFETPEGLASTEDLERTIVEEDDLAKMPEGLFDPLDALKPPKGKPVDAISALIQDFPSHLLTKEIYAKARQAKMDVMPKDGADELARSYNLTITKADGTKYNQRYTAMGEKIGKEIPLGPEDYKAIDGYLDGVPTTFFRNDETGEWKLDKAGNPKAHPWPKGFDKKAPKDSNDLNIKFSAFLEANEQYWNLLPWRKDKTKGVIAFDPVKWFMTGTDEQREAVVDFKNTSRDATVAILNAMTKLIKARSNQGKGTGAVNPEALKKALDNKRRGQ